MAYLGESSQLTIGTSNLSDSIEFYNKLGFRIVKKGDSPYPWCKLTDGSLLIFLNQNGSHYLGFSYFVNDWGNTLKELQELGAELVQNLPNEKVFFTPQDLLISLVKTDMVPPKSDLKDYMTLGEPAFKDKSNLPNMVLGAFGELACPTLDLDGDTLFYQKLGFKEVHRSEKPYKWCILSDGLNIVGLHETTDFQENSITYFAPDVADQVRALEAIGIENISEFTGNGGDENNVCITTAENQTIFFFNA
jgi:catechol 2,3-dioxygenase-like lactoylglutathione lyase family enzyme